MIETLTDITVERDGTWRFQGQAISNEAVLHYFQANLRRDAKGYFIRNEFGELVEHGYLKSMEGFPVRVTSLFRGPDGRWCLRLESGAAVEVETNALRYLDERTLVAVLPTGVPARLSGVAMAALGAYLIADEPPVLELDGERLEVARSRRDEWLDPRRA